MKESDNFTKRTAQIKLDRIEKRLKIAKAIAKEIKGKHKAWGYIDSITIDGLLNQISTLLENMTNEIQIDLYDLKTCLHHLNSLPIRNKKGELE